MGLFSAIAVTLVDDDELLVTSLPVATVGLTGMSVGATEVGVLLLLLQATINNAIKMIKKDLGNINRTPLVGVFAYILFQNKKIKWVGMPIKYADMVPFGLKHTKDDITPLGLF